MKGELFNCLHSVHSRNREEPAYHVRIARLRRLLCGGEILTASLSVMHVVFITSYIRLVITVFFKLFVMLQFTFCKSQLNYTATVSSVVILSYPSIDTGNKLHMLHYFNYICTYEVIRAFVYCAEGLLF